MEAKVFTRNQLYELVWQRPLRDVARELGISDVALGKACRRHLIPLPGRGYWAQIAAGQKLTQIPLPSTPAGMSCIAFTPTPAMPPKPEIKLSEKHQKTYADEPFLALSTLSAPHPIVKQLRSALRKQDVDRYGLRFGGTANSLSMTVSPSVEERALIILDTLLQRLKAAGAQIQERPPERYRTEARRYLILDGEELHLSIREPYRQQRKTESEMANERNTGSPWPAKFRYFPSGRLVLSIDNFPYGHDVTWSDGKLQVEAQLSAALKALLALPDLLKEKRLQAQEAEKRHQEEQWRQYEIQRQAERRQHCLRDLLSEAERFRQHRDLSLYLDEIERQAAQSSEEITDKFHEAMAAARLLAKELLCVERRIDRFQRLGLVPERELAHFFNA